MSEIITASRFLIGVRWDGRLEKFTAKHIDNPAQFCVDRLWTRIEGVRRDWSRFVIYKNPYPLVLGYGFSPKPDPGPTPEWEKERAKKEKEYKEKKESEKSDDYF